MNRYFAKHGRITFGLIAIVISVSFVLYLSRVSVFDMFTSRGPKTASLLGRKVTGKDRMEEARRVALFAALNNPVLDLKRIPVDPDSKFVYLSLLQYYAATDMGVAVGDESLGKYIREKVPGFQTNGKFDIGKYNDFVERRLKPAGFSKKDLDDAIRRQLAVERMRGAVVFNVVTTQNEMRTAFDDLQEKVKAEIIWFDADEFAKKINPTEEDVKNHFESHRDAYQHPPAAKARIVLFPYEKFRAQVEKLVTLEKIKKYYEANKYRYIDMGKSKNATAGAVYKPFAAVEGEIRKSLAEEGARGLATDAATRFSDSVYSAVEDVFYNVQDPAKAKKKALALFEKKAAEMNLNPVDSGWVPQTDAARPALAAALAKLAFDSPVSEPAKGKSAVVVAFLVDKKAATPKTFDEAKAEAKADFIKTRSILLAREAARNAAVEIAGALDKKNTSFEDTAKKLSLKVESLPELKMSTPLFMPSGAEVSKTAFKTPAGAVSEPVNTREGAFIVHVVSKIFPTDQEFAKGSVFFAQFYAQRKRMNVYQEFVESLMAASELNDKEK
jgi:hypothetical protein